ncbi:hypothetical protein ACFMKY_14900 [Pseudomonas protegens]|uniref:hypothetical protein n=1 Tax=Pseudomonas protegens TaxID=380021 RepID=UPI0036701BAA
MAGTPDRWQIAALQLFLQRLGGRQPGRFGQQEPGEPAEHQQQQQGAEGEQVAVGRSCS